MAREAFGSKNENLWNRVLSLGVGQRETACRRFEGNVGMWGVTRFSRFFGEFESVFGFGGDNSRRL